MRGERESQPEFVVIMYIHVIRWHTRPFLWSTPQKKRQDEPSSAVRELFRGLLRHRGQPRRHERARPPPVDQESALGGRVRRLGIRPGPPPSRLLEEHVWISREVAPGFSGNSTIAVAAATTPAGDDPVGRVVHPDGPDLSAGGAVGIRAPGREPKRNWFSPHGFYNFSS